MKPQPEEVLTIHILIIGADESIFHSLEDSFVEKKVSNPLHYAENETVARNMLLGENGEEKLTPSPQIVLLDLELPELDLNNFLNCLQKADLLNDISLFRLISDQMANSLEDDLSTNFAGTIVKPLNFDKFVKATNIIKTYWTLTELS